MRNAALVVGCLWLLGCSDGTSTGETTTTSGASAGSTTARPTTSGSTTTSGTTTSGGTTSGGTTTSGSTSTSGTTGSAAPASILPYAVGSVWTYAASETVSGESGSGTLTDTVTGSGTYDGRDALTLSSTWNLFGVSTAVSYVYVEGDDGWFEYQGYLGQWVHNPVAPVTEGASWSFTEGTTGGTCTWHDAGSTTVPAGTFSDCWRADCVVGNQGPSDTNYSIYCRGVGVVASAEIINATGFSLTTQLTSKNF